jgi:hypothetical protein
MLAPVDGGIFISTERYIYFFRTGGERPVLERRTDYPAFKGSACFDYAEGLRMGAQAPGLCAFWRGSTGACVGFPDGSMINMTESKVAQPATCRTGDGASLLMGPYLIHTVNNSLTLCTNIEAGPLDAKATTQYTNHAFNSYCRFGNNYLAASSSGLYLLGGALDVAANIDAYFAPVMTDFGDGHPKRIRYLYFGYESADDLTVTVYADEQTGRAYTMTETKTGQQRRRLPIGKDGSGRYWTVKIANTAGCDFSIDTIDAAIISRSHGVING